VVDGCQRLSDLYITFVRGRYTATLTLHIVSCKLSLNLTCMAPVV
jgi:hypothetical protein